MSVSDRPGTREVESLGRRVERRVEDAEDIVRFLRGVGDDLRRFVPFAFDACWFTIDPSTLLITGHYNAHLDDDDDLRRTVNLGLAINEYQQDDVNKFAELALRRRPAATLHRATHNDPERSARYRTLLKPLGAAAELRVAIREKRTCWAGVALYRQPGEADFDEREIELVLTVTDRIARGVRRALLLGDLDAADPDSAPGLVLLDEYGQVEAVTVAAERWLEQLLDPSPSGEEGLPHVVHVVAARCREDADGFGVRSRVPTRDGGWLVLHASSLGGGEKRRTAVIIEPALPADVAHLRLQAYGLTPREREVATLVLLGQATDEIAGTLFISPYTVQDHLKSIFGKVGVSSRRELIRNLATRGLTTDDLSATSVSPRRDL